MIEKFELSQTSPYATAPPNRVAGWSVPNAVGSGPSPRKYPGFRQVVLGTPGMLLGSNSEKLQGFSPRRVSLPVSRGGQVSPWTALPYPDDQFIRNLFPRLTIRATCITEQDWAPRSIYPIRRPG